MIIEIESLSKLPKKKFKLFTSKEPPKEFVESGIIVYNYKNFYFVESEEDDDASIQTGS
jgi:hypothetical protein